MNKQEKELKQKYIDIVVAESWSGEDHWRKYYQKDIDRVVETEKGYLIGLEKPRIEKDFCFGYSLSRYDDDGSYERAGRMAAHARTSQDYFISENMKQIDSKIEALNDDRWNVYTRVKYIDAPKNSLIRYYEFHSNYDVMVGRVPEACEPLSEADKKRLIEAYEAMKVDFAKRLNTYLKRYGLSKVNSWSYWKDA